MSAAAPPPYEVRLPSRRVQRELDALSQVDHRRILATLQSLAQDPRPAGAVLLEDSIYRVRVGRYRIIYLVNDRERVVHIGGIRRRSESTYRGVRDLF